VVGERALDSSGTHSWWLLSPDISLEAHWLPIDLYRFEDSSFSTDFAASAPTGAAATPEASTWAMTLIGFAGLSVAGYRNLARRRFAPSPRPIGPCPMTYGPRGQTSAPRLRAQAGRAGRCS
jgi:hypothetical protein